MPLRSGGKTEAVLRNLALRYPRSVPRDAVLAAVWPDAELELAVQSLNSLIYGLHKQLGWTNSSQVPVVHVDGSYRLNPDAGVGVDVAYFDALVFQGEQQAREDDSEASFTSFIEALEIYHGDLVGVDDVYALMERERLRAQYLTLLCRVADHAYQAHDYGWCLRQIQRLLVSDPCREDAHRLAMRCYVRLGQRAQAMRQYSLCREMLRREFDAVPEPSTTGLYNQIRLDPTGI